MKTLMIPHNLGIDEPNLLIKSRKGSMDAFWEIKSFDMTCSVRKCLLLRYWCLHEHSLVKLGNLATSGWRDDRKSIFFSFWPNKLDETKQHFFSMASLWRKCRLESNSVTEVQRKIWQDCKNSISLRRRILRGFADLTDLIQVPRTSTSSSSSWK